MNFQVVVDDLIRTHACHAIILYGSYSRGDFNETSDLDIVGIKDDGNYVFDNRVVDRFLLDAHISSQKRIDENPSAQIRIHNGKILYDSKGAGRALLEKLTDVFQKG